MKKFIFTFLASIVLNVCLGQKKDKDGHYYLPSELSSYVDTRLMNELYSGVRPLNSLNFDTQKPWVVFSDRSSNKTMNSPNSVFPAGPELEFMEPLYVTEISGSWLKVQKISERVKGKLIKNIDVGWLHADKTVLSRYPVLNESKSTRKAMALISLESGTVDMKQLKKLKEKYLIYEDPTDTTSKKGTATKFQIYYILKELNGMKLLSPTDQLTNNKAALRENVAGWMNNINLTTWDSKVCLEPSSGPFIASKYGSKTADIFDTKEHLKAWRNSGHSNIKGRVKSFALQDSLLPPLVMRMPILSAPESNQYQTVKVATVGNPNENSVSQKQRINLQRELKDLTSKAKDINIVFVVDGTLSMKKYYKSVAGSIQKILNDSETLAIGARIRFGAVIYRDYADEPNDVEVFPLTANKSDIERWLMDVRCYSNDNDKPEAQYNGIINGLDQVGMSENESNVVVLIGDAGNHQPDPEGYTVKEATTIMSKYQANFISFQVIDFNDAAYNRFNRDAKNYLFSLGSSRNNGVITAQLSEKPNFDHTYELKFLSADGKDYTDLFMFGFFTFASRGAQMSTNELEDGISLALSNYLEQVNTRIQTINSYLEGRTSANKFDPQIVQIVCESNFESPAKIQECTELLSNLGEFSYIGYTDMALYGSRDVYNPVVFVSYKELSSLQDKFAKLSSPMLTKTQQKQRIYDALVGQMKIIKDDPIAVIEDKTLNEIWELMLSIPFDQSGIYNGLGNVKLKDIRSNQSDELQDFLEDVAIKSKGFNATKFKSRSFEVAGQKFFWIPLTQFPGNG